MGILLQGIIIPCELAEEILFQSCCEGSNPQQLSLVCQAFAQTIRSNTFWKKIWEHYAVHLPRNVRLTIQQQFDPNSSFRESVILLSHFIKNRSILSEGFWSTAVINPDKTIDIKVMPSPCGLLPPFPEHTASLTITQNPHLQILPMLPKKLTHMTVTDSALLMLPSLSHLAFLKILIVTSGQLKKVNLKDLPSLEVAHFNKNLITVFTVENCPRLKEVNLEDNQLTVVPSSLAGASALEELRLAGNHINQKPKWLKKIQAVYFSRDYSVSQKCLWSFLKKISHR